MPSFSLCLRFRSSCFALSGAAVILLSATVATQAQTPTFNVAEYADSNENADYAALSFADKFAQPTAVASVPNAERTNQAPENVRRLATAPTAPQPTRRADVRSNAPKSQAAQIWEAFLFGAPRRPVSTPKFAFAQRDDNASAAPSRRPLPQLSQLPQTPQAAQTAQTRQTQPQTRPNAQPAQSLLSPSDEELAAARRRRLQELNAFLAARRPEEFSRRLALNNAANATDAPQTFAPVALGATDDAELFADDAPALPILADEPTAPQRDAVRRNRAEFVRENADAPFDAARANRSKIRQASNLEPREPSPLELADDGLAAFVLPTRPNALRISPNVFLSTDLVRLPSAAPLLETAETPASPETARPSQDAQASPVRQPVQPLQTAPVSPEPRSVRPLQSAQSPATVALPLPPEPSTDVPTLRPTAQFVEPRFLPSKR